MHLGTTPQGHVQQKARVARKSIRLNRLALDQAGVAHGCFLARRTPVHQRHVKAALLQMQGGAGAHHARTQNKDGRVHKHSIMQQHPGARLSLVILVSSHPGTISGMKRLSAYFFRGLITFLPVGLTVYALYLFVTWVEGSAMRVLRPFTGDFYLPGLGIVLGTALILVLGFLVSQPFMKRALGWVELPFTNLPLVKSIYSSLKSFADYFAPHERDAQQVVLLKKPDSDLSIIGLVTRQSLADLPLDAQTQQHVAVYLPMGYMIGGYTVFVPRDWVQVLDMSVEEAMRSSLTAWMGNPKNPPAP